MNLGAFSGVIYSFCTWFYRLAFINILWLVFTAIGLVLFGFFPATIAMLATLRQYIKNNDVPVFTTFWNCYKGEFIRGNKLGAIIVIVGFLLMFNINFLQSNQTNISQYLYIFFIIVSCFCILIACYLLASYVEFDQDLNTRIKNSILIAIYNPLANLFIIFGFAAVYYLITFISGISLFFSVSILGLVILSSANIAYRKIESKQAR